MKVQVLFGSGGYYLGHVDCVARGGELAFVAPGIKRIQDDTDQWASGFFIAYNFMGRRGGD